MSNNTSGSVSFLYGTRFGRVLLKIMMKLHLDRIAVRFLCSRASAGIIKGFARRNNIPLTDEQRKSYRTYRDFFVRTREPVGMDMAPDHFISPCDGWLSAFPISSDSCFSIKGSHYRVADFLHDETLAENYLDGLCLVFRLCASDYHHYCYIDDGYQGKNNFIQGVLHSVQPICCEKFPVYVLNRRSWCLLTTEHFGPIVQCEIGALVVGGIYNEKENTRFCKGTEKGHFELAGSTIVLLVEKDQIELNDDIRQALSEAEEARVLQGQWIATQSQNHNHTIG